MAVAASCPSFFSFVFAMSKPVQYRSVRAWCHFDSVAHGNYFFSDSRLEFVVLLDHFPLNEIESIGKFLIFIPDGLIHFEAFMDF